MPKQIHAQKDADLTRSSHPSLMPHTPASTSRYMTSKQQTAAGQEGFCVVPMRPFRLEVWKRLSVVLCAIVKLLSVFFLPATCCCCPVTVSVREHQHQRPCVVTCANPMRPQRKRLRSNTMLWRAEPCVQQPPQQVPEACKSLKPEACLVCSLEPGPVDGSGVRISLFHRYLAS